jgi:acetyltransferase-like isoleucine patch superfamily enzyme
MKLNKLLKRVFSGRSKHSWKYKYNVGKGTYGDPKIEHWGEPTTLKVGNYCSISGGVKILLGGNHRVDWITTHPFSVFRESAKHIKGHPVSRGDVVIGHDVWIGIDAIILSGVDIGNGAIVGASAVVSRDVPAYSVVAGNPANVVKQRFSEDDITILQSLKWWHWNDTKLDAAMPYLLSENISGLKTFSSKYDLEAS